MSDSVVIAKNSQSHAHFMRASVRCLPMTFKILSSLFFPHSHKFFIHAKHHGGLCFSLSNNTPFQLQCPHYKMYLLILTSDLDQNQALPGTPYSPSPTGTNTQLESSSNTTVLVIFQSPKTLSVFVGQVKK